MPKAITFVLGGGRGTRLFPLTQYRSKPAVPLAGKYRLIDIPLSNCINSGLRQIYILTQFLSVSLHRHVRQTYTFDAFTGGYVELLAAQQTMGPSEKDWYQGTADAVRKNLRYIEESGADHVVILSGDQLYRMDYREMIRTHVESGAHATIAGIPVDREQAKALGIMRLNETGRVEGFLEKPQNEREMNMVAMDPKWIDEHGIKSEGRDLIASMGIYVFNCQTLIDVLTKTTYEDFGREIFPAAVRTHHVQLHAFDGYWEDIGTIRAFYEANLSLTGTDAPFELSQPESPIYSRSRFLPPSKFSGAQVKHSLVADGCHIGRGAVIENSVIGLRCIIGENVTIRNSVLMGADEYETKRELAADDTSGIPHIGIGEGSVIEGAIVDKNCRIGRKVRIVNENGAEHTEEDSPCLIREGIPVVVKNAVLPDGWTLG